MTMKEHLKLMEEIKAANDERVEKFLEEGKAFKHWFIDYAAIRGDDSIIETDLHDERLFISAPDIGEALKIANDILGTVAPDLGWKKWMIWNIGIANGDSLF